MRTVFITILLSLITFTAMAQTKITLSVGNKTMAATLADTDAARELAALLAKGPLSIEMSDYGGFEKVGSLLQSFTSSNRQITTVAGDIMLYQGNNIVIFYGSNSWSYTRLGKIDNATAESVGEFLGNGDISMTISLSSQSGIEEVATNQNTMEKVYDLNGRLVTSRPLPQGVYIVNGQKTLIK